MQFFTAIYLIVEIFRTDSQILSPTNLPELVSQQLKILHVTFEGKLTWQGMANTVPCTLQYFHLIIQL